VFVRYPPGKIRYEGDRPVALLSVRVAPSFRLVDLPLGLPTTSARTSRGTWALYPIGAEVVVVHPDGAVSGPAAEVATEVGRLATRDRQGDLDRQAAWTIQRLLTGDDPDRAGPGRPGARTWSIPAKAYWLSGPDNHHGQPAAGRPDHPEPSHGVEPATGDPATPVASPPGPASNQIAGSHRPKRNLHRPRHGRPFRFKQRVGAGTSQGGNANHEDHGRL
jgi:hypothetical protein